MIRLICSFTFLVLLFTNSNAQVVGEEYIAIPKDNGQQFILKFSSDSTLEITTILRHMMPFTTSKIFSFLNSDTSILILPNKIVTQDTLGLKVGNSSIFEMFKKEIILGKIKDGFIDYNSKLIYVRRNMFDKTPNMLFVVDGKEYIYDSRETNSYGLIVKNGKQNNALIKRLKKYNSKNSSFKILKGLDAYYQYGLKGVFGTFVTTKNK